jgi:hypothetical protein
MHEIGNKRLDLTPGTVAGTMAAVLTVSAFCMVGMAQVPANSDPVIEAARASAAAFARSLPDYLVKRTTARYKGLRANRFTHDANVKVWQRIDSTAALVTYRHGTEVYANIEIDGKSVTSIPANDSWTVNEFSSVLLGTLTPTSNGRFTNRREEAIANQAAFRYDYAIDQSRSTWHLDAAAPHGPGPVHYTTAYGGEIWIDKETGQVLRIERLARGVPDDFPLDAIRSITDYAYVQIGEGKYVVPTHSESWSCERNYRECLRSDTVFGDYKKFGAESTVIFDNDAKWVKPPQADRVPNRSDTK